MISIKISIVQIIEILVVIVTVAIMTVAIVVGVGFRIRNNTSGSSSRKIIVTNGSKTGAGRGLGACDSDPSLKLWIQVSNRV